MPVQDLRGELLDPLPGLLRFDHGEIARERQKLADVLDLPAGERDRDVVFVFTRLVPVFRRGCTVRREPRMRRARSSCLVSRTAWIRTVSSASQREVSSATTSASVVDRRRRGARVGRQSRSRSSEYNRGTLERSATRYHRPALARSP